MTQVISNEEVLERARQVEQFLTGAAGKQILGLLKEQYEQEWKQGKTVEEREAAFAKAKVVDDFVTKCSALMSAGKRVAMEREREEKKQQLQQSRNPTRRS